MKRKKVIITGASSGVGRALAIECSKRDMDIILVARQVNKLEEVKSLCAHPENVTLIKTDLGKVEEREALLKQIDDCDILINNAGYGIFQEAEKFDVEGTLDMFEVNTLAPIHLTTKLLPKMYEKKSGHIIFVASQASKMATPKASVYSATKFGIRGFANALRLEAHAHNVKVTTVNPGPIATNFFSIADKTGLYMKSLGRYIITPEKVAQKIMAAIDHPKREVNLPFSMSVAAVFAEIFPNFADFLTRTIFNKK